MSVLDDTCVLKRVGAERAAQVKRETQMLLDHFTEEGLRELCMRFSAEGISPGGAADMLALTIFTQSIIN
jgi:triphosphoribosyl-dephospho-CoA synthetase